MYHNVLNASTLDSKENHFMDFQLQFEATHYLCNAFPPRGGGGGGREGLVPEKLEGDVQPASQIPYPSYDQTLRLCMNKICDIPYPIYDLTNNS